DRQDGDDDDPRDVSLRILYLVAEVADVVVAEVVVDRGDQRRAEAGETEKAIDTRRAPEGERLPLEMRQTDADDDRQREQHADPEQDREFSDRLDPPQKKQRGD